jgi:predicted NUDIX family NTP pyrophosphohydrolase
MMNKRSAGLLLWRRRETGVEVLIGHMGGPFWETRDEAAWSIPKGEYAPDEEPMAAARREFEEELGLQAPDTSLVVPGTFTMEWPRGSGRFGEFPEIDRAEWHGLDEARRKLVSGQRVFLDRLIPLVGPDS